MIKTSSILLNEYKHYLNPKDKIRRLSLNGELIPIVRGFYETDKSTPGYYLASTICGPSYLSFNFALAHYGLIPEAVYEFTSATFGKNKSKIFKNYFGVYSYRDIPMAVYPYGIKIIEEKGYVYQIATPEKALCDKLYTISPIKNQRELEKWIFDDMRIDEIAFNGLNKEDIISICNLYHSTNLNLLEKYLRRISNE
jgi:hypothetical protein